MCSIHLFIDFEKHILVSKSIHPEIKSFLVPTGFLQGMLLTLGTINISIKPGLLQLWIYIDQVVPYKNTRVSAESGYPDQQYKYIFELRKSTRHLFFKKKGYIKEKHK